jgi:HlyD family secretion protein
MRLEADSSLYRRVRNALCIVLGLIAVTPALLHLVDPAEATAQFANVHPSQVFRRSITAPGRIQPRDGVLTLSASANVQGVAVVGELWVNEGDLVERDQVLATLQGREELEAEVAVHERQIEVARAKLAALQAGGKREDIQALQAELEGEAAKVAQLTSETQRARQLRADNMLSQSALEAQEARLSTAVQVLEARRARLKGLSSVRPADLAVAEAELAAAISQADVARARLANQFVRAPAAGRILRVHAYPGQAIGPDGLLSFGRTNEMFVDAEVMEQDIARARVGQPARISGDVLAQHVMGIVERVGVLVGAREVFELDPSEFADSRIVHVLIRVDDPVAVERFVNARVTVEIDTGEPVLDRRTP